MKKVFNKLSAVLILGLLLGAAHTSIHNEYDHVHDASCSVYVLEQLYASTDLVVLVTVPSVTQVASSFERLKSQCSNGAIVFFTARAPPRSYS